MKSMCSRFDADIGNRCVSGCVLRFGLTSSALPNRLDIGCPSVDGSSATANVIVDPRVLFRQYTHTLV